MKSTASSGFTLVELLVVISIVALLMSLLLPALDKSRETAKTILCMSRMRDMGSYIEQYRTDNKTWYPVNYVGNWPANASGSVVGSAEFVPQMTPYMGTFGNTSWVNRSKNNHFLCPSDYYQPVGVLPGSPDATGIRLTAYISTGWRVDNYMMSGVFGYGNYPTQPAQYRPRREIKTVSPSVAVMMSEIKGVSPVFGYVSSWGSANIYPHNKGTNVLFAGGNVKTFTGVSNIVGQELYLQNGAANGLEIWFQ